MKKRSMGFVIAMSILCPFYAIYWYCSFQNQLKKQTNEGFGGFGHLMATIFSFGIYGLVWSYKVGSRLEKLGCKNQSMVYLILSFLGLTIVVKFLVKE